MLKDGLGLPATLALPAVPALAPMPSLSTPAVPPLSGLLVSVPTLATGQRSSGLRTGCVRRWGTRGCLPRFGLGPGGRAACPAAEWPQGGSGTRFFSFPQEPQELPAAPELAASGSAGHAPAAAGKGLCQAGRPPRGTSCAYPDPVPEVSPFSVGKSFQLSTLRFHCSWGGESRLNEPLFSFFPFFARTHPTSPRLDLKCLFSSASPGLSSSGFALPSQLRIG